MAHRLSNIVQSRALFFSVILENLELMAVIISCAFISFHTGRHVDSLVNYFKNCPTITRVGLFHLLDLVIFVICFSTRECNKILHTFFFKIFRISIKIDNRQFLALPCVPNCPLQYPDLVMQEEVRLPLYRTILCFPVIPAIETTCLIMLILILSRRDMICAYPHHIQTGLCYSGSSRQGFIIVIVGS